LAKEGVGGFLDRNGFDLDFGIVLFAGVDGVDRSRIADNARLLDVTLRAAPFMIRHETDSKVIV